MILSPNNQVQVIIVITFSTLPIQVVENHILLHLDCEPDRFVELAMNFAGKMKAKSIDNNPLK